MERDEAITQLPVVYQRLLSWIELGWSDEQMAAALGIDLQAVGPLIRLAEAKLARLTDVTDADERTRSAARERGAQARDQTPGGLPPRC